MAQIGVDEAERALARSMHGARPVGASTNRMQKALSRRAFARHRYATLQPDHYEREDNRPRPLIFRCFRLRLILFIAFW
ncbi:hypothetical protein [Bradyrhizobium sp. USDA 10063]